MVPIRCFAGSVMAVPAGVAELVFTWRFPCVITLHRLLQFLKLTFEPFVFSWVFGSVGSEVCHVWPRKWVLITNDTLLYYIVVVVAVLWLSQVNTLHATINNDVIYKKCLGPPLANCVCGWMVKTKDCGRLGSSLNLDSSAIFLFNFQHLFFS